MTGQEPSPAAACHSCTPAGQGVQEHYFALQSAPGRTFAAEAEALLARYDAEADRAGCSADSEVLLRIHMSDITTQLPVLKEILGTRRAFLSFVGQPPAYEGRLAIEAAHLLAASGVEKSVSEASGVHALDVRLQHYALMYHCCRSLQPGDSGAQMNEELDSLQGAVVARGGTLKENCVRTWIYGRDIDNSYAGIVASRREYFKTLGMNESTHYIASTGIDGQCSDPHRLVGVDSLSVFGLAPGQVVFMQALEHMPPTHAYGVTFERGTCLRFGDRSHFHLSGTASIDAKGNVMHVGDVARQAERMVETVAALLGGYGAQLSDLRHANIYLRDTTDAPVVSEVLAGCLPACVPRIMIKAPVCRPNWLVEMDGVAIMMGRNDGFPPFS